jgi:hypothetical protein
MTLDVTLDVTVDADAVFTFSVRATDDPVPPGFSSGKVADVVATPQSPVSKADGPPC